MGERDYVFVFAVGGGMKQSLLPWKMDNTVLTVYFPSPEFKYRVRQGEIDEKRYAPAHAQKFLRRYRELLAEYKIGLLQTGGDKNFIAKWYLLPVRREIDFLAKRIAKINDVDSKAVITIMLSRTMRSCRATTHADLATLKEPMTTTYYCAKRGKSKQAQADYIDGIATVLRNCRPLLADDSDIFLVANDRIKVGI